MTTWDAFAYFGIGVAGLLIVAIIGLTTFVAAVMFFTHFPRLHAGRPKNPMTLQTHDAREILTGKDGAARKQTGRGALLQDLTIKWWVGLSSRNNPKWFFGLLRCDPRL